jgi:tight adherence protein C
MAGLVEIGLLLVGAALSTGLIVEGAALLVGETQLNRRIGGISEGGASPEGAARSGTTGRRLITLLCGGGEARAEIERHLAAAGYLSTRGALIFAVARLGVSIGGALALYAMLALGRPRSAAVMWAVPILFAAASFLGAKALLRMSSARRSRKISAELPFTLDLLVMMVESGASLDQCFRAFAAAEGRASPIVRMAVAQLVDEIQRGMSYDAALARWADRLGVNGARELAGVLRQSLSQGTELAGTLREFAREFGERRVFAARESIGRKTTQMTIAMLVLLMPALMIVLAGPAVSTLGTTITKISNS